MAAGSSASLWAADVDCVVLPVSAFGGDGVQALSKRPGGAPLFIAVEENTTVLKDTPEACNIQAVSACFVIVHFGAFCMRVPDEMIWRPCR